MSKDTVRTILYSISTFALSLILVLLTRFGIDQLIDVAPTAIFLGIWLPFTDFQAKNHRNELSKHMEQNLAAEFADAEFKRSFFLEASVIQAVYALIFAFRFNNLTLEWILLVIVGSLSIVGYRFSNRNKKLFVPVLAIPICAILLGEAGYILGGKPDDMDSLWKYSMIGFVVADVYYLIMKFVTGHNTITKS